MSAATKAILTNKEIIAVDQDPLGQQATLVATPQTGLQVWSKLSSGNNVRAVALFNRNGNAANITVSFTRSDSRVGRYPSVISGNTPTSSAASAAATQQPTCPATASSCFAFRSEARTRLGCPIVAGLLGTARWRPLLTIVERDVH